MPTPRPAAAALAALLCLTAAGCAEPDSGSGAEGRKTDVTGKAPPPRGASTPSHSRTVG